MRRAIEAYLEIGNQEAAHLVEHGLHARELRRDGRRDDEARRIIESAPDDARLAQLLHYAGLMVAKEGDEEAD